MGFEHQYRDNNLKLLDRRIEIGLMDDRSLYIKHSEYSKSHQMYLTSIIPRTKIDILFDFLVKNYPNLLGAYIND